MYEDKTQLLSVELIDSRNFNGNLKQRIAAIAYISGVCRNKHIEPSLKFYDHSLNECDGRPNEIFEFLPVVFKLEHKVFGYEILNNRTFRDACRFAHIEKDSEFTYVYSNSRAFPEDYTEFSEPFFVFKITAFRGIRDHFMRHNMLSPALAENWSSSRHISESRLYIPPKIWYALNEIGLKTIEAKTKKLLSSSDASFRAFCEMIGERPEIANKGVASLYLCDFFLGGWYNDPLAWKNFFNLRDSKKAMPETRYIANMVKSRLIDELNKRAATEIDGGVYI